MQQILQQKLFGDSNSKSACHLSNFIGLLLAFELWFLGLGLRLGASVDIMLKLALKLPKSEKVKGKVFIFII